MRLKNKLKIKGQICSNIIIGLIVLCTIFAGMIMSLVRMTSANGVQKQLDISIKYAE